MVNKSDRKKFTKTKKGRMKVRKMSEGLEKEGRRHKDEVRCVHCRELEGQVSTGLSPLPVWENETCDL